MRFHIAALAMLALAACASSTPVYAPALTAGATGYSETQIESNRYFVSYRSNSGADAGLLQDYALLRAAELTLQNGREWFWVDRRDFEEGSARSGGPTIGIGIGGGSWGGRGGVNVGVGVNLPIGAGSRGGRARAARLEIRFGEGVKPDDANAYDARSISANLRSRLSVAP